MAEQQRRLNTEAEVSRYAAAPQEGRFEQRGERIKAGMYKYLASGRVQLAFGSLCY